MPAAAAHVAFWLLALTDVSPAVFTRKGISL